MKIKQEQFMQLFGEWDGGYTPSQVESKVESMHEIAKKCGDRIGMITCEQLLAACYYAETGDSIHSVTKRLPIKDGKSDIKDNGISFNVIKDMVNKIGPTKPEPLELSLEEYCDGVLEAAYVILCKYTDLQPAITYLRQYVFSCISPIALSEIEKVASIIGESVLKTMVNMALAEYEKNSGAATEYMLDKVAINSFDRITRNMVKNKERVMELPSLIYPEFNQLTETIVARLYGDMPTSFMVIDRSITDAFTMLPHEIFEFSLGFSNIVEAYLVGIAAGIFDYEDYKSIVPSDKEIKGVLNAEVINNIERMRSN